MLIGLSQRVECCAKTGEIRDCLDQSWSRLLADFGHLALPIPNNPEIAQEFIVKSGISGILLTGGNDLSSIVGSVNSSTAREETETIIISHVLKYGWPILGVCRGFQAINEFFGGSVTPIDGHAGVHHQISLSNKTFGLTGPITVNSFHNYALKQQNLADSLVPFAYASDGTIEAAYHCEINCMGIMWHPERSKSDLDEIIIKSVFR